MGYPHPRSDPAPPRRLELRVRLVGSRVTYCSPRQCPNSRLESRPVLISSAFAQTAAPAASPESSLLSLLPLVAMFVVLYFIMIRPQMKRQKEHKLMVEALAKGDEVITAGGVLGKVSKVEDNLLHVEIAKGVEVQIQRSAVTQVLPKGTLK